MNLLHIFKSGTHTDMHGRQIQFTEADIKAMAEAYDPALHEAPIVVGHPKTDDPAYGWVKSLSANGADMMAEPHDVDPAFAELVDKKRFKKISASFYLPDSAGNPKPGVHYLRHVGFLGAQPPAIKGLKQASFGQSDDGVVEFADWGLQTTATLFSRLRDYLVSALGLEKADTILSDWMIDGLRDEAIRRETPAELTPTHFSEHPKPEDTIVDEKEKLRLESENADLKRQLAERKKADVQLAEEKRHGDNVAFAEKLISDGKLAPAAKNLVTSLLNVVGGGDTPIDFAEGNTRTPLVDAFKTALSSAAPVLVFGEMATKDNHLGSATTSTEFADADPVQLALHQKALALSKAENISYEAAVSRCL
ncbi:MAG: peptidase [Hafnia sp.]